MNNLPLDRQLLLCHVLNKSKTYVMTWPDIKLSDEQRTKLNKLLEQRAQGVPLAYLTGIKSFWDMDLKVTPEVLIPRPETELLVETALDLLEPESQVLELATGSGAIACALYRARSDLKIIASDISEPALEVARENARTYQCDIDFIQSDWFSKIPQQSFDLILANPPYLSDTDPHLSTEIRFEPNLALVSGKQGDEAYQAIISQAKSFLKPGGRLLFEHGCTQANQVQALFREHGFNEITTLKDLAGLDRVTMASS